MTNCTSTIIAKLTETVDYLLGSCMPKAQLDDDEVRLRDAQTAEALRGPKDDKYRKEELKQLVGMFASRAQSYIDCVRLALDRQRKLASFYRLDPKLENLTIKTGDTVQEIPVLSVGAPHAQIKALRNFDQIRDEKYAELRANKLLAELSWHEKNRFVLVEVGRAHAQYAEPDGREGQLAMLVEEVGNSDPFIAVMRILTMYANDKKGSVR